MLLILIAIYSHLFTICPRFILWISSETTRRQLTLPDEDPTLPRVNGVVFSPKVRWFGFSDVSLPQAKFDKLRDDPEVCRPKTRDGGSDAFGYRGDSLPLLLSSCIKIILCTWYI